VPGEHDQYDLYSIGPNGVDEGGLRDDVSAWAGVNPGFHYKAGKVSGRIALIGTMLLAALLFSYGVITKRTITYPLAGVALSVGLPLSYYLLTMAGPPQPVSYLLLGGLGAAMAIGWGWIFVLGIRARLRHAGEMPTEAEDL
jgi:hypothetical protein